MREALRVRSGRTPDQLRAAAEDRYIAAMSDPDARLLVAVDAGDGGVLGLALLVIAPMWSLFDAPSVAMSQIHVTDVARRRGAGRALVAAAAQWAEERGVDTVSVSVTPHAREFARFYARLGFAPVIVRRSAPLSILKRRLGPEAFANALPPVLEDRSPSDRRGMRARLVHSRAGLSTRRHPAG
jgi:GNAT superfamily N-acetyltransferase